LPDIFDIGRVESIKQTRGGIMKTQTLSKTLFIVFICLCLFVGCSVESTESVESVESAPEIKISNVELEIKSKLPPERSKPFEIRQEFWQGCKEMHYSHIVLVRKAELNEPHFEWHTEVVEVAKAFDDLSETTFLSSAERELGQFIIDFSAAALEYHHKLEGIETVGNRFEDLETLKIKYEELEQIVRTRLYETEKQEQYY
jgi:hypothetical protein